ncbi:TonB-dependent receptor [Cellulophaga tyrosinoxydans]|uniref:Outer membrane receptor proteins, mostly Fe transport n=1 Tax=Cellulophaga tyrosinoxydans TaxID=504486 RepID=A0A1W1YHH8_9FLAO|nr:TonB-dependent receptor [Cellulophaga tyrosinoxydans]SMC35586.1 Outer membrane receptor proteins, mostly Fe transport [Cellulophaga tyrosinoxydans]
MNSKQKSLLVFVFLFFGIVMQSHAQNKLPAKEAFEVLKERYSVTFSFIEEDISSVFVTIPDANLELDEVLQILQKHPMLTFKKIGKDRIAVAVETNNLTICGTIIDADTKEVLVGSLAIVVDKKGTISDLNGSFRLIGLKNNDQLTISFLGYEPQKFSVLEYLSLTDDCPIVALVPQQFQLQEVVVRNLFTTGFNQKRDGSIDFSTGNYGILPGLVESDVLQMIQVLPGVQSVNESIADINVRGGSHDQNLIHWDHIKMYHSGHFFGLISAFNPEITNQVTVVKNGTSAEYTDGVSGSIFMSSNNEIDAKLNGSVSSNLLSANAVLQVPINKKMAIHISGRRSLTDFYNSPTYNQYFERSFQDSRVATSSDKNVNSESDFYFYDFSGKFLYNVNEKHKLRISLLSVNNQLSYTESSADTTNPEARRSNLNQENFALGGTLSSDWSTIFNTELQAYYSNYNLSASDLRIDMDQSILQLNQVLETGIKLNTNTIISENFSWLNGYSYSETGTQNSSDLQNPTYQIIKKRVQRNHGFFSELSIKNNKTFIRAGARLNYFERLGTFLVEPRLNINHKLSNTFSLNLQGEFKNQTITQFVDLNDDFLGVENRRWIVSDGTTIPIIKSKQVSLGFQYKNSGWFIELNPYYKKVEGIITESQGFTSQNQFDGFIGSSTAKGMEFLVNKRINNSNVWASYTYGRQNYIFKAISSEDFPSNFDITHTLNVATSITVLENWKLASGIQFRTGRPYTKPVEGQETYQEGNFTRVNYGDLNVERLPSYMRLDASTSYDFKFGDTRELSISLGVLNILNKNNILLRYYEVSPENSNEAIQIEKTSLALTPNISCTYKF